MAVPRRAILPPLAAAALAVTSPSPAYPCSPSPCRGSGGLLPAKEAAIPANAPGLLWRPRVERGHSPPAGHQRQVALFRTDAGTSVPVDLSASVLAGGLVALTPATALVPGGRYVLQAADFCEGSGRPDSTGERVTFRVRASAPQPTRLGGLRAQHAIVGPMMIAGSPACRRRVIAASATLRLELDPAARPWATLLRFETLVDGRPWWLERQTGDTEPLAGDAAAGQVTVAAACDPGPAGTGLLAPGRHTVQVRARLPGLTVTYDTPPVTVELSCDAVDGGCALVAGPSAPAGPAAALALLIGVVIRRRRGRA